MKTINHFLFLTIAAAFFFCCNSEIEPQIEAETKTDNSHLISLREGDVCEIEFPCYELYTGPGCAISLSGPEVMQILNDLLNWINFGGTIISANIDFAIDPDINFATGIGSNSSGPINVSYDGNPIPANVAILECNSTAGAYINIVTDEGPVQFRCQPFILICPEACCN